MVPLPLNTILSLCRKGVGGELHDAKSGEYGGSNKSHCVFR